MSQRPVTLTDIVAGHVSLAIDGFDRIYLNGWVPALQTSGQVDGWLGWRGVPDRVPGGAGQDQSGVPGRGLPVRGQQRHPVGGLPQGRPEAGCDATVPDSHHNQPGCGTPTNVSRTRPAFGALRRLGFEGQSGLGEESVDEGGPVLDALEPVPDDGGAVWLNSRSVRSSPSTSTSADPCADAITGAYGWRRIVSRVIPSGNTCAASAASFPSENRSPGTVSSPVPALMSPLLSPSPGVCPGG